MHEVGEALTNDEVVQLLEEAEIERRLQKLQKGVLAAASPSAQQSEQDGVH